MDLIHWSVRSSNRIGERGWIGDIVILAIWKKYHFIGVHDNLVQHPSSCISIALEMSVICKQKYYRNFFMFKSIA